MQAVGIKYSLLPLQRQMYNNGKGCAMWRSWLPVTKNGDCLAL